MGERGSAKPTLGIGTRNAGNERNDVRHRFWFRGRMTLSATQFIRRGLAAIAIVGLGITAPAFAASNEAASAEVPVDLDAPDTAIDSSEAEAAVSAADVAAAAAMRATPQLANRVPNQPRAADTGFQSLFSAWRQMDGPSAQTISIPSRRPVEAMRLTSTFGHRSDPFTGRRARHNGIDIPGPIGTPIYATADGVVGRAQRAGGYGNLVEIDHGNGMQTRYGHLSQINVQPGQRVRRGDVIALMGSTGRSTGSHLHYEVRIAGAPVNPEPFIADDGVMVAAANHSGTAAVGGPRQ